jgi:low affinity Fe/Cu permease
VKKLPALERLSHRIAEYAGSSWAFFTAAGVVVAWAVTGPMFGFSDTWQLVINTGTTIITFLMVFLIQRSQNKDTKAVHLKLNELVAALQGASNRLVDVEDLCEEELAALHHHFQRLAEIAKNEGDIRSSHSIEEAEKRARGKLKKAS